MIIRHLEEKDIPTCIYLGARMHEESDYRDMEYSPDKCLALGRLAISDPDHVWLVAEEDGQIIGMMGGFVTETYFGHGNVAADHLIYVAPEKRGGIAFIKLVKAFYAWAKDRGAQKVMLMNTAAINTEKVDSLYSRLGFEKTGVIYRGNL